MGRRLRDHRFEHLRGGDDRFAREVRFRDELLLRVRDFLDRHFHAEIAARDHDAIGHREDFIVVRQRVGALDLRDDERHAPDLRRRRAHGLDVRRALDERLAHRVHARAERKLQARAVVLGERADAEVDARQIQPLARTQLTADRDRAFHVVARDALDDELHETVVEKEPVPRLHHARQRLEAHRDALRIADDVFIREREAVARHELDRLRRDLPEPHLRPRQIGHDGHAPARRARGLADAP